MREKQRKGRPTWWRGGTKKGADKRRASPAQAENRDDPAAQAEGLGSGNDEALRLYGIHAVEAALRNPDRRIVQLLITDNAENRLGDALRHREVARKRVDPRDLDRILGSDSVHQGVMAEVEQLPMPTLDELAAQAASAGPLVVLDQVTDPHNVGAIMRSAAVFGATGLVMTRRHSPPLDGVVAKAASGALEHVPVALVANLARALAQLGELGLYRVGLDGEANAEIDSETFTGGIALVLGAEGHGLRRLTRENCDILVRIGASGAIASLNVSNAAAVALHIAAQRRKARPA
jgi:23S rRNA (guanosine2251-2'-O)-methyltransferase